MKYMERALQIARRGLGGASPNPMVGAVIVAPSGRIIGEGYHRTCGGGHAEVHAIASVTERGLLGQSTMYVTLEPCAHYGKTPPCAELIIRTGIPHVVVGMVDPFSRVSGRGIAMMREAGVDVELLDPASDLAGRIRALNRRFLTAHTLHRPLVTLKWAQSADGFMDSTAPTPYRFSTPLNTVAVHRLRALHDAIAVGSGTMLADNPRLTVREWTGRQPQRLLFERTGRIDLPPGFNRVDTSGGLDQALYRLYDSGISSVLVEGGPTLLQSFISENLWDEARVEIASGVILGAAGAAAAPVIPRIPDSLETIDGHTIARLHNDTGC